MNLVKVTERIFYLPGESSTDRPFLYYIKGDNYSVAIDAGNSEAHVRQFYEAIKSEGLELPTYTIITHWHWDHTFGLPFIHGKSIASELTCKKLREVATWKWTLQEMKHRETTGEDISFCNECIAIEYKDLSQIKVTPADTEVSGEMILDLGDMHLRLISRDSTHSRDSLFIYAPEEQALFIGDADCEDHYENHGKYDRERLVSLIEFIKSFEFTYYFMGHDMPETKESVLMYLEGELAKL